MQDSVPVRSCQGRVVQVGTRVATACLLVLGSLGCSGSGSDVVEVGGEGSSCSMEQPCSAGLECVNGKCVLAKTPGEDVASGKDSVSTDQSCLPACDTRECGGDGCGGSCGECGDSAFCLQGACLCEYETCGDVCCAVRAVCVEGECCKPSCENLLCGDDGCGGSCGECAEGEECQEGDCVPAGCVPDCEGKQCGDDGCEGQCGTCGCGEACEDGLCVYHGCDGLECGPDGCGGDCGDCSGSQVCSEGVCVPVTPGLTCGDIFKCGIAKGCALTNALCWSTCFGKAGEDELQAFEELTDCVGEFCEQLPPEEQGDCLMSQCIGEVSSCLDGKGDVGCLDSLLCIQGCGQDDDLCFFECIEESSEESLILLLDMSNATEIESFALVVECVGGEGDKNCGETVMCFTSCEDNPPPDDPGEDPAMDCETSCIAESSPEGAEDLIAFMYCAEEACPNGMDECPGMFACMSECPGIIF